LNPWLSMLLFDVVDVERMSWSSVNGLLLLEVGGVFLPLWSAGGGVAPMLVSLMSGSSGRSMFGSWNWKE
jgi:hypothetical protein